MMFPTTVFALFFLFCLAGAWCLNTRRTAWKLFILATSYYFYGFWNWHLLGLLMLSTGVNYALAIRIRPGASQPWVAIAVTFNLLLLGIYKYYGFFSLAAAQGLATLGLTSPLPILDIVLPVGISFYSFQAISYVIDVARGDAKPGSLLDFAVYKALFPQLVAGPIVRASKLMHQIAVPADPACIDAGRAAFLIVIGLAKKMVIANTLASKLVDPVFSYPEDYAAIDVLLAVYGYAVQIYCDFSAYSDIAIGLALLFGLRFSINFDAPYFATSIREFWRGWHISLSTWLRDYLYIPLGGSRGGTLRTCRNVWITFLLGGIWHGAGWNFIIWGALHATYLTGAVFIDPLRDRWNAAASAHSPALSSLWRGVQRFWVFHLVCLSWLFFRSATFEDTQGLFTAFLRPGALTLLTAPVAAALITGFASQFLDGERCRRVWDTLNRLPGWALGLLAALALNLVLALGPEGVAPFIYFQF